MTENQAQNILSLKYWSTSERVHREKKNTPLHFKDFPEVEAAPAGKNRGTSVVYWWQAGAGDSHGHAHGGIGEEGINLSETRAGVWSNISTNIT